METMASPDKLIHYILIEDVDVLLLAGDLVVVL